MNAFRFSDIHVGMEVSFVTDIDETHMDTFAALCGDTNPLHTDAAYATAQGFKDRVVHGLLTSSFYSTLVGVHLPGKYAVLHGIDIAFLKPVYAGDTLNVSGKVTYINEAYKQIEIKARIVNQAEVKISKATIKVGLIDA